MATIGFSDQISTARAVAIASWNFNDATVNATTLAQADGGLQASTATIDFSNIPGGFGGSSPTNGSFGTFSGTSGNAIAIVGTSNNNRYITFNMSMTGYEDLTLGFQTRGTSTGFSSGLWSYSTDGSSYTAFAGGPNTASTATSFSAKSVNFSSVSALDNAANVYLRYTLSGASGATGNNRLDDIVFSATEASVATATTYSLTAATTGPNAIIVGGSTSISTAITNTGSGTADTLAFSNLSASATNGSISSVPADSGSPLAQGANSTKTGLLFSGTSAGEATITPTVDSATNGTLGGAATLPVDATATSTVTVLDHANGAFDLADTNTLSLDFGTVLQGSSVTDLAFQVYNLVTTALFTAELDLAQLNVSGTGDTSVLTTNVSDISDLAAGDFQAFLASFDTSNTGDFSATYTFGVSDNTAYDGAALNATALTLELTGSVHTVPEPSSIMLLIMGAALLTTKRRWRPL